MIKQVEHPLWDPEESPPSSIRDLYQWWARSRFPANCLVQRDGVVYGLAYIPVFGA